MEIAGRVAHLAIAAAFQLLLPPTDAASAGPVPALLAEPSGGPPAMCVSGVARSVIARLKRPECLAVLSDFRDGQDHLLKENLAALRMTAPEFFTSLTFVDGSQKPVCGRYYVAAFASPGIPVISVCTPTFVRICREDRGLAADLLIHEMLHALGLGENPPTSLDITLRVRKRCEL
jgi:hypothetical protein